MENLRPRGSINFNFKSSQMCVRLRGNAIAKSIYANTLPTMVRKIRYITSIMSRFWHCIVSHAHYHSFRNKGCTIFYINTVYTIQATIIILIYVYCVHLRRSHAIKTCRATQYNGTVTGITLMYTFSYHASLYHYYTLSSILDCKMNYISIISDRNFSGILTSYTQNEVILIAFTYKFNEWSFNIR